ncbi:nucleotidyltransferase domain-containing protein [Actinoplanes sp. NBRC 103695]|uniref:nucleotidyltransferase domain-containing protein n=1 Tax=Actinoplanes sp. NBRC 103695 TaxID=3032202 RepID=UPI0024A51E7C|nr:nucleotidyltransferase domain-containing protein [Actinoplanes sp. NBRC 103695]GLY99811.1 hypothetical protein Acsp02_70640 [Actinoplanes sp. NBRC 103695]
MKESSDTLASHLQGLTDDRDAWLKSTTGMLTRHPWICGVWVVGSLGRDDADAFSDIDLVVAVDDTAPGIVFQDPVAGLGIPGEILFVRPKPVNAPTGGAYLAAGIDLHGLPLLVDVFVWPSATAAVSRDATVVFARRPLLHSPLDFIPLLDEHPSDDRRGSDPDAAGTVLMWVMLAAKHWSRGNQAKLVGVCEQLGIPADRCDARWLDRILDQRIPSGPATGRAVIAVRHLLTLAEYHHAAHVAGTAKDGVPPR